MSNFNEIYSYLSAKRKRALSGMYNCIPFPFKRFSNILPGTEMGKFILVSANQKVGKTKFCDFVYVYQTIFFILEHPEVKAKILYFCLEESPRKKYIEFISHLLFKLDGIRLSTADLSSIDKDKPLPEEILTLIKGDRYQKYIKKFEEIVQYIGDCSNPTGINKACREYALSVGHLNYKTIEVKDPLLGTKVERKIIDPLNPYTPNDSEEYKIVIVDNASNITTEQGLNKMDSIEKLSKYAITLRDQLNYTFILIQHQNQSKEGIDSYKYDKLKPSADSLADSRKTVRDINLFLGLYSPFKYGVKEYEGYDITKLKDNVRFLEVLEDRDYGANGNICPLYFDGVTSNFIELPKPDNQVELQKIYEYSEKERTKRKNGILFLISNLISKKYNQ